MIYTSLTKKAMKIAYEAHRDAVDKGGTPYIFHPLHLAESMTTQEETAAAILHDVLEDTPLTEESLREMGIPENVIETVVVLTKSPNEDYLNYIKRVNQHPVAKKVKQADLLHNCDTTRLDCIDDECRQRLERYKKAIEILSK